MRTLLRIPCACRVGGRGFMRCRCVKSAQARKCALACVCLCVCVCACVCMGVRVCVCARTWRARVCEMGCTCVGSRCGSSSHRRSHSTQEWHLFRLAALHGAFDGVHFVHVFAHAYVHAKWQRALLHTVAYDASCVAFFEAILRRT